MVFGLLMTAVLLGGTPVQAAKPARSPAPGKLKEMCQLHAADPGNPWALAHGITAWGPAFSAADGRLAADVIVGDFAEVTSVSFPAAAAAPAKDAGTAPSAGFSVHFAMYGKDGTPIEPHSNLHAKTMVLAGMPLSRTFKTRAGQTLTLQQVVDSVKRNFASAPSSAVYWQDVGWTLDLLSHTSKPGDAWVNTSGATVSIDAVMDDALKDLEVETAEISRGLKAGLAQVDKRKQGIYAHSCGGLHLVQAVLSWARFPAVRKKWGKRLDEQIDVLIYRLGSEKRQYDAAYQQAPEYRLQILVQMLKFYGHFLETTARLRDELGWKPSEAQLQAVAIAKAMLDSTWRELEELRAYEKLAELKKSQRQIALDLIGDSCHAAHGLGMWE